MSASEILRPHFLARVAKNPKYSLRAFARDLGVSPAFLSMLFSGKKSLSVARAMEFQNRLKLGPAEAARLRKTQNRLREKVISSHVQKSLLRQWFYIALLELATCEDFVDGPLWAASRLGLPPFQAEQALQLLKESGFLILKDGKWVKCDDFLKVATQLTSAELRAYHIGFLEKAIEQLSLSSVEAVSKRSIHSITFGFDPSRVEEARQLIEEFRKKWLRTFKNCDLKEVYQLNIQLFPLSHPIAQATNRRSHS